MFNKIKGFFKNLVTNIKYVLHGIKKLFVKAEDTVQAVAEGRTLDYDKVETVANGFMIAAGVASVLLASKMMCTAKAFDVIFTITTMAATWFVTHFLMVYGAQDYCPEGSHIEMRYIWNKKKEDSNGIEE